jgi:hypothetical protein
LCGFDNEGVLMMLHIADECDGDLHTMKHKQNQLILGSVGEFSVVSETPQIEMEPTTFKMRFNKYKKRSLDAMMMHANARFEALATSLCPHDPEKAVELMHQSATYRKR